MLGRVRILSWLLRRGRRFFWARQWSLGRRCFEQVVQLSQPGSRSWQLAQVYLARVAERLGDWAEARQHLRQLLRYQPRDPRWHYRMGRLWRKQGRWRTWQTALRHLRLAVKLAPDRPAYWAELGRCWADAGKPEPALRALRRAWSLKPQSLRYLAWLLELLLACDRQEEAQQLMNQARFLRLHRAGFDLLQTRYRLALTASQQRQSRLHSNSPMILPFFCVVCEPAETRSVSDTFPAKSAPRTTEPTKSDGAATHRETEPNCQSGSAGLDQSASVPIIIRMDLPEAGPRLPLQIRRNP